MVRVRVPCTTANMGSGFDALGTALALYNELEFEERDAGIVISEGGREPRSAPGRNLVYLSLAKAVERGGYRLRGVTIKSIERTIPVARGLGSSAACIAAGILAADSFMGGVMGQSDMVELATEIEGHPDNVVPAIVGGMTVSVRQGARIVYCKVPLPRGLSFVAMIPEFRLNTKQARKVLPRRYSRNDCVYNLSRAALLTASFAAGDLWNLRTAVADRLHQPYRLRLIPGAVDIMAKARELGSFAEFISGSGPTLMALVDDTLVDSGQGSGGGFRKAMTDFLASQNGGWRVIVMKPDFQGARVLSRHSKDTTGERGCCSE